MANATGVNLVTNGGFETSAYTGNSWHTLFAGSSELTGWTVGGSIDINGSDYPSHSGSYNVDLAGTPGPGSISQTIGSLTVGESYTVSFWAKGGNYPNDQVDMTFGSESQSFAVTSDYALYTFNATASSASQFFELASRPENNTVGNVFIDDVSVTATEAVPEPMTLAALGFGLAAIVRKRRK